MTSSVLEAQAFQQAWDNGMLTLAAAGNRGGSSEFYPASYDSVVSVGATDEDNAAWQFTQHNAQVELVAPGVGVYSTVPGNQYRAWDGTSMAVPYVTGVAAHLWSQDSACSNQTIRDVLQQSALDLGDSGRDNTFGYGLVQLQAGLAAMANQSCGVDTSVQLPPDVHHVVQTETNASVDIPFIDTVITSPEHGELALLGEGVRYTPTADYKGFDQITYRTTFGEQRLVQVQVGLHAEGAFVGSSFRR